MTDQSSIKAIETEYAGCRFRSRLEARWAVFFDKLGIRWLYEPQGYVLGNGERYLPDFWLPDNAVWAEVKGSPTETDLFTLHAASAADGLPISYEGGASPSMAFDSRDLGVMPPLARVLLLGEIPRPTGAGWIHFLTVLTGRGPGVQATFLFHNRLEWIGNQTYWPPPLSFTGHGWNPAALDGQVADAYDAARKARFEHGESGYMTPALREVTF